MFFFSLLRFGEDFSHPSSGHDIKEDGISSLLLDRLAFLCGSEWRRF
jgi:hypothetical protein